MVRREATAPLLANEDPRDSFDEDERVLLAEEQRAEQQKRKRRLCLGLGLAVVLASAAAIATTYYFTNTPSEPEPIPAPIPEPKKIRNVIMMISDGFGPASQTYGRSYWQYQNNFTESALTSLDNILVGASRTRSSNSLVTDSAAGATAFSCAMKSYNAAIGVDPSGAPCGTVLEAAKEKNMLTGLVVTSRVTHATPAAFSAHVVHRDMEDLIAQQQIGDYELGRQVDLMLGGGRCFFLPNTTEGSCRTDNRNLIEESQEKHGWKDVLLNRRQFDEKLTGGKILGLPTMGLFHLSHMNFEIDRQPSEEPALHEMTQAALDSLTEHSIKADKGFFLMIEGSRIDMGAHNNDPVAHVHEILEYHRTVALVREFVANNPDTVMISTSDHETGGFTLGLQPDPHTYPDYLWRPEVIERASASTEILTKNLFLFQGKHRRAFVRDEILAKGLGIRDPTEDEIEFLADPEAQPGDILVFLGHAISRRANLGWTTIGHTGVDVNLYADAAEDSAAGQQGVKALRGNHENTDIGKFMTEYLDLDLAPITERLITSSDKWFKRQRDFSYMQNVRSKHEETGH